MTKQIMGLVFLVLMMTGCQRASEWRVPSGDSELIDAVSEASARWCQFGEDLCIPVVVTDDRPNIRVEKVQANCGGEHLRGSTFITPFEHPSIKLCPASLTESTHVDVLLHEMGHGMRADLDHIDQEGALMRKHIPPGEVRHITTADVEFVRHQK